MSEFLAALADPDIPVIRHAFFAGVLASLALGIVGSFTVARRITYVAGAISHSVLGGIGAALFLQSAWGVLWLRPLHGAVIAGVLSAMVLAWVNSCARQREDTAISAVWAVGMASGLLFLARTPGYVDPMSYLFGDILLISRQDLWLIVGLDALVILLSVAFYNKLLGVCFDETFARVRGVHVNVYYLLLLILAALTVVLLVTIVGIVLVIALLTLPAAVAAQFARRMWQMMALAAILAAVFTSVGLMNSYLYNLPSGPVIILFAAAAYALVLLGERATGRSSA